MDEISLDLRYKNYWLDLIKKEKEEERKKELIKLITIIDQKNKNKP